MENRNILKKLKGSPVVVISKEIGNESFIKGKGTIMKLNFPLSVLIDHNQLGIMDVPFAGISTGIYQIEDIQGNILYENKKVLDSYINISPGMAEEEMQTLRSKGKFFLD